MGRYDRLLDLIEQNCTIEQVKSILRPALGNKNVKLSAPKHNELVQINLRAALDSHSLNVERVYELLRESEENGPQHIFYFRCGSKDVQSLLTLDYVRKTIFGSKVSPEPLLDHEPNGFVLSEVRAWSARKPADWAIKIYGHEAREVPTGEIDRSNPARIARYYRTEELRFVLLVRWNSPDLLELRVPATDSRRRLDSWMNYLYETVRQVVPLDRFLPWRLSNVSRRLFDEKDEHVGTYSLGDVRLEDEFHNIYSIQSFAPDANLFSGLAADSAAKGVLEHNGVQKAQRVLWLKQPDDGFDTDISTLIGARQENEVVFSRHQSSRGIDYVTQKLRAFSRSRTSAPVHVKTPEVVTISPNSFERLARAEPQLQSTYEQLAKWADEHEGMGRLIDPGLVARDIPAIDEFTLADALQRAVQCGYFRMKYTVLTPAGGLAQDIFDSPGQIPRKLPDRFEEYFETREYPIVAILQSVEDARS